ncbi:MAG: helicase C-terminal domain-containing protein [Myxococcota bacterium]
MPALTGPPRALASGDDGIDLDALAPWLAKTGPVAVVDFETTGLPQEGRAEPIEVGAVLLDGNGARCFESRIRPQGSVPAAITALTGLRDADLRDAPSIGAVAPELLQLLSGRVIVAHNADFERHFLTRFLSPAFAQATYLDTQDILGICFPDSPDLRLATFVDRLLEREERHRALSDAVDAAAVLSQIARRAHEGDTRFDTARAALETYAPEDPWLPLLATSGLPLPAPAAPQFIRIPKSPEPRVPFDADAIAAALADEARGRRHFPRYRVREPQIEMAREFVRLLDEGGRLLLEGGTGVGKSLAYLAAAIPFAVERAAGGVRDPVVISTRTKVLQDQLLRKDIPAAAAFLGYSDLRALSIKGRANYLCQRRTLQALAEGESPLVDPRDRRSYAALASCTRLRPHGEVGTLPAGLLGRFPPLRELRKRSVAARAEHCTREQCASEPQCPFGKRRSALGRAELVVANHDLLLRWPPDYPNFGHVIADEAHELVGVADEAYATEVRPERLFERLDALFGGPVRRTPPLLRPRTGASPRVARGDLLQELRLLGRALAPRASDFGEVQLPPHAPRVVPDAAEAADRAAARLEDLAGLASDLNEERGEDDEISEQIERDVGELRDAAASLRGAFAEDDAIVAAFDELHEPFDRWRMALRAVSPARAFHGQLLEKLEAFAGVSASLFVGGDAFAAMGELEVESGEAPSWRASLPSPFDYASHMRVVALVDRGDPVELTTQVLTELGRALGGRTLGLFTSLLRMREVQARLSAALRPDGIEVWMPRRATDDPGALVERFRRAGGGGVLLGARTFWQGIDVPGPALEAVVIEKLPFEVPNELRRRREGRIRDQGGDAFELFTLGKMLLNLKQMVGRLIRSEDDRGLVVVVDPRRDKPYFERLSAALPPGCEIETASLQELVGLARELELGATAVSGLDSATNGPESASGGPGPAADGTEPAGERTEPAAERTEQGGGT